MDFKNAKIYLCHEGRKTIIFDKNYEKEIIQWITDFPEEAVPGALLHIYVSNTEWTYEIISLSSEAIHLKWLPPKQSESAC